MKKITALLLVLVMALGLSVGCAQQEVNTQPDPTEAPAATEAPVAEATPEVVASAEPEKPELSGTMKVVATGDVYGPLLKSSPRTPALPLKFCPCPLVKCSPSSALRAALLLLTCGLAAESMLS